jgi:hypothetical protein
MAGPRNGAGVNDAANCYRTINGARYIAWLSFPTSERIEAYRAAGVRCRRFGEELFVHLLDEDDAKTVDAQVGPDK